MSDPHDYRADEALFFGPGEIFMAYHAARRRFLTVLDGDGDDDAGADRPMGIRLAPVPELDLHSDPERGMR